MEKKTPLYDQHIALGAKMQSFAGYMMPIKYSGIIPEHKAVRESVGVFDLSHMGEFRVTGRQSAEFLDFIVTNDAGIMENGQAIYTTMCYPDSGIVDDLLIYRLAEKEFLLIVNASNIDKDWSWINSHMAAFEVELVNESDKTGLVAIQGPRAQDVLKKLTDVDLESIGFYYHVTGQVSGRKALIARTGYTGEDGFELYLEPEDCPSVWEAVLEAGKEFNIVPVGLGARDTLRLEMGYCLYGNDIDHTTSPLEARLGWVLKLKTDKDFIGRELIVRQKDEGVSSYLAGFIVEGKGFARHGTVLFSGDRRVGHVTSGTLGPALGFGVGLAYIDKGFHKKGSSLEAEVRGKRIPVKVVRVPFYKEGSRR